MSGKNIDWKEYEAITKYIYETLGKEFGVTIEGYGHNFKVVGKSGVQHQIDVLTKQSNGVQQIVTAIECKNLKKKITKDIVMKLLGTINDAQIDKGIIVSKSGFTKDATDFAREYNIGLVELREIQEKDLLDNPKEIHIADLQLNHDILITRPQILKIDVGNDQHLEIRDEYDYFNYSVLLENQSIIPLIDYVNQFRKEVNLQNEKNKIITKHYDIQMAKLFNRLTQISIEIHGITFSGQLIEIGASKKLNINLVDQVWLIMKTIFEERVFTFSDNGYIVETKSR